MFTCDCGREFSSVASLNAHRWRCGVGKVSLKRDQQERKRLHQAHKVKGMFACECGATFRTYNWLVRHVHFCEKCSKAYQERICPPKNHVCEICGQAYGSEMGLTQHKQLAHDVKTQRQLISQSRQYGTHRVICRFCGKQLKSPQACGAHERSCDQNPNCVPRQSWNKGRPSPRKGKNKYNDPVIAKQVATVKEKMATGQIKPRSGFHLSEEAKEKIRQARFTYLNKKLGKTAWERRQAGEMSYIEQWFYDNIIQKYGLCEKFDIVSEYAVYPYFLDFAFVDQKIDFELDGLYHLRHENHDKKRDEYLQSFGWRIYRISATEIKKDPQRVEQDAIHFIQSLSLVSKQLEGRVYSYTEIRKERESQKNEKWQKILEKREQTKQDILKVIFEVKELGIDTSQSGWKRKYKILTGKDIHRRFNEFVKKYAPDCSSLFFSTISTTGKCWISNVNEQRSILVDSQEIDKYLSAGWIKGRSYYNNQ